MRIRAENDPRYHYKFLIMGGLVLLGALWFLKDGIWGYPARERRGFEDFKYDFKNLFSDANRQSMSFDEFKDTANDEESRQWNEYAQQREIPTGVKITEQFAYAILCALLGFAFLWGPLRSRGRWIEASDEGLTSSWGESFRFDEVEVVNKRAW